MPNALVMIVLLVAAVLLAVWWSQRTAHTPPILDPHGQPLPGSIAALECVQLGGNSQWITLRGKDVNNPVLLYLAGGPGGSDLAWTRRYLSALEDHFVVVNWDQAGSAKSFGGVNIPTLTPERYVTDACQLTEQLRERFGQEKIYLLAHSWGSVIGVRLAQQHPEYFHAYIGTGQLVRTVENDVLGYELALKQLEEQGNSKKLAKLKQQGPPPYHAANLITAYAPYMTVLNDYMTAHAKGESGHGRPNLTRESLIAPEYSLLNKLNLFRGAMAVFSAVYPQIEALDFMAQVPCLDVPAYFLIGRWDVNTVAALAEQYYQQLQAPHKALIWFEQSGHTPHYEEPQKFVEVMVEQVLGQRAGLYETDEAGFVPTKEAM